MYFFSNILNLKVPDRKITFENLFPKSTCHGPSLWEPGENKYRAPYNC